MENNTLATDVEDKAALTETIIRIIGLKGNKELEIEGGDTTQTEPGKLVRWEIIATDKISEIYLVLPEDDPSKVFTAKLDKQSGFWEGRIKSRENFPPHTQVSEKYTIIFKKTATGSRLYIFDPIIQVNA